MPMYVPVSCNANIPVSCNANILASFYANVPVSCSANIPSVLIFLYPAMCVLVPRVNCHCYHLVGKRGRTRVAPTIFYDNFRVKSMKAFAVQCNHNICFANRFFRNIFDWNSKAVHIGYLLRGYSDDQYNGFEHVWPLPAKQALLWTIHVPHYSGNVVAQCKSTRLLTHRSQVRICHHSHWKPLESVA